MNALALAVFAAATIVAISAMLATVRRYGGAALALQAAHDAQWDMPQAVRARRSSASRYPVGTPRRALARGRTAQGQRQMRALRSARH